MCFSKKLLLLLVAIAGTWIAGCAVHSVHVERTYLSDQLQQRTGRSIRSDVTPTNQLPPDVELANGVNQHEAAAIALWNNAAFQKNLSKLGLARADLAQAGLLSNPTFSILFPLGPKQLEFAATFPLEALWLRLHRLASAELDAERVAHGLVENGLGLMPLVLAGDKPDHEIELPMAVVILGGLITSTVLNLVLMPALYGRFGWVRRIAIIL